MSSVGIRANTISPGFVKTSFYKNFKKKEKNYTDGRFQESRKKDGLNQLK